MTAVAAPRVATAAPAHGCATVARTLGEAPEGTATPMGSWLLIEHPEAWTRDVADRVLARALPQPRLRELTELRRWHGLRPLLVRRPGYRAGRPRRRTVLVGGVGRPGDTGRWLERLELGDLRELADLDLAAVATGAGGLGLPVTGPVFGVCTHGSKDMCCATLGRPVAKALAEAAPGRVWESTHLGGDRFAGNVLVLPAGFLYGHVSPATAARLAAASDDDLVLPELLRGRTSVDMRAQVAEIAVRRVTGLHGVDDVEPVGEDGTGLVVVRAGGRRIGVRLGHHPLGVCGTSRCAGPTTPCGYSVDELVDLD
jgi:Sucrase/ferredoxin-like